MDNNRRYYTQDEAAELLRITAQTLKNWRRRGYGPVWAKVGGKILYSQKAITKFFNENISREASA